MRREKRRNTPGTLAAASASSERQMGGEHPVAAIGAACDVFGW